jgi:hypothetical protein
MTRTDYARLLIGDGSRDGDFIEVHIYGTIHRRAVASARAAKPKRRADQVIAQSIGRKLKEIGIVMVIE